MKQKYFCEYTVDCILSEKKMNAVLPYLPNTMQFMGNFPVRKFV